MKSFKADYAAGVVGVWQISLNILKADFEMIEWEEEHKDAADDVHKCNSTSVIGSFDSCASLRFSRARYRIVLESIAIPFFQCFDNRYFKPSEAVQILQSNKIGAYRRGINKVSNASNLRVFCSQLLCVADL